jgi:hypothetical protein
MIRRRVGQLRFCELVGSPCGAAERAEVVGVRSTMASIVSPRTLAPFSETELERRRPVWLALSELFLDTSLDSTDINRIAATLVASHYSLRDLDRILVREVYPACRGNLLSIAGEWAGFDAEWLETRILRGPSALSRAWAGTVGRLGMYSSPSWRAIRRRVEMERLSRRGE